MSDDDPGKGNDCNKRYLHADSKTRWSGEYGTHGPDQLRTIFQVLAEKRRRHMLYELRQNDVTYLDSLVDTIATERAIPGEERDEKIDRLKVRMIHSDIPLLVDSGLVEYDSRSGAIRYSGAERSVERILDICADVDRQSREL
ncbi:DUF7344 domain-containing protein [Natrarchaeobius chitinivorans]|uniref:DUF7344 domain-containing protein n=1 Tax=Natrarchaeobius chitinivorans TaxID=1679083 RepID=A0A3N6LTN7_NATCH|nr:hypothetical protein [Natrarchaeobius chitinivorans]RQG93463.1 hypothetical protein EA473_15680 [Natrarchaeobius chitinivorans]